MKTASTSIRISNRAKERLDALAADGQRKLSQQVDVIVDFYVATFVGPPVAHERYTTGQTPQVAE